jgi:acetyltransferase-like isoleucine patch superfamily enzyme
VHIGEGAYIGAGALIREKRSVGAWALVGMAAAVTKDVPAGEVWAGIPARFLRDVELPDEFVVKVLRSLKCQGASPRGQGAW